jgi:hypothetical protein
MCEASLEPDKKNNEKWWRKCVFSDFLGGFLKA